ncbi:hypothetical protein E1262_06205 [Jiangella aurantiaca]|uniref:Uncharacterized protein n=1 Tax=Jiangella aurantiaca TaxID=2530373 RepID=A0A4R5AJP9_9ACTN|nr:hypothetical protein [Jiangella aurantiaca]TDD71214.1 hypothetical protein E1262_06205 [Jiangella aurantiaca]
MLVRFRKRSATSSTDVGPAEKRSWPTRARAAVSAGKERMASAAGRRRREHDTVGGDAGPTPAEPEVSRVNS